MKSKFALPSLLTLIVIFIYPACNVEPSFPPMVGTQVRITGEFLGFCREFSEGATRGIEFEVAVDGLDGSGNPSFMWIGDFNATNSPNGPFYDFPIEIPTGGTFAVTVTVRGLGCFECCRSQGCLTQKGTPRFRGNSVMLNAIPPPAIINVVPSLVLCNNCGC